MPAFYFNYGSHMHLPRLLADTKWRLYQLSRLPFWLYRAVCSGYAVNRLERRCVDYSIYTYDWPRHGFHYKVQACHFWCYGSGYGTTLAQATALTLRTRLAATLGTKNQ